MDYEIFETKERVLAENDAAARSVRTYTREKGTFFVNLMASPGAGKTTALLRLIERLGAEYPIAVMEADADGDTDAAAIAETGTKVIQLHTGGLCHMDADMTLRGLQRLGLDGVRLCFLENVGNLVCPAEFDTGADLKMMILSVPEGDDKPLKYPLMFQVSDLLVINKTDVSPIFDFDMARLRRNVEPLHPGMPIFPVCARTGEGFEALADFLRERMEAGR